ncbi:hypothetical protein IFM89_001401 [Coptis chinensis]|uniref:Pectinesterase inhibitor domain-containing protein n=1 Tax=Coptis chinensis TaxID=261450 RepID=A0A835HSI1_9MAGN|nr:hypothetical protein IFM89_001401 [Coptis chinensis]
MNPIPTSRFFALQLVTILLIFQSHQFVANNTGHKSTDLVTQTCEKTAYKDLCIKTLKSHPASGHAVNVKRFASVIMNAASDHAINMSTRIEEMLNKTTDSTIQECFSDCSEYYVDATDQLEDSLAALDTNGYKDVKTWLQAAIADVESCQSGFKEQSGHNSTLASENERFSQLCHIALEITNHLAKT